MSFPYHSGFVDIILIVIAIVILTFHIISSSEQPQIYETTP